MIDRSEASRLAQGYLDQLDGLQQHTSLAPTASDTSLDSAYLVQEQFHSLLQCRGDELVGYKIALTSKAMQEFCGVDQPCAGGVFARVVHDSPYRVELGAHRHLGVEFEVAVRMGADLVPGSGPHTRDSIAGAVRACHPAFELVEDRNADYSSLNLFDLVGENTWNAGVVLGEAVTGWDAVDLVNARTLLVTNGEPVGEGRTGDALGHPLEALAWLANHLNDRGETLRSDQFVMTGSSIVTQFPVAGDELVFTIDGLGEARLTCA